MAERSMARACGGLGANQIRWLRTNMKPFDDAWKAVQASDAHARKIRTQLHADAADERSALDPSLTPVQRLHLVERRTRRRGPVSA